MILPIVAYGHQNLRKKSQKIGPDYPDLAQVIQDMWDTMYYSKGVGLAAPQVNKQIRLIVIDGTPFAEEHPESKDFKKVFINPEKIEERGEEWAFQEGCLSIPGIHEDVIRHSEILLRYQDEQFNQYEEWFTGVNARIIQHEYDHLEGVLFVDKIHPLRKIMLKRKLTDITKGISEASYKMIYPPKKR